MPDDPPQRKAKSWRNRVLYAWPDRGDGEEVAANLLLRKETGCLVSGL